MFIRQKDSAIVKLPGSGNSKPAKPRFWKRKSTKITMLCLGFLLLVGIAWALSTFSQVSKIFTSDFSGGQLLKLFNKGTVLKGQEEGRVNILLLGYGGAGHDGAYLTDTIQVMSLDTKNNKVAMISIPRDLNVQVKNPNYSGKINAVYEMQKNGKIATKIDDCNPESIKNVANTILGVPIHYYVSLDFSGFKKMVDAVGGVDITVDRAFTDYEYPADTGDGYLPAQSFKAGQQHMNGAKALVYARSRHAAGSEGSDFARSVRQQKVLAAFREKLMSNGTLANPSKVTSLIEIVSSSLRTDLQPSEIKALAELIKAADMNNMISQVLGSGADGYLSLIPGTSSFQPSAGANDWSAIQMMTRQIFTSTRNENAKIEVLNGSKTAGVAASLADTLKSYGYNIVRIDKTTITDTTVIYDYSNGAKKDTLDFLKTRLNASVTTKTRPAGSTSDIVVIVGNNYQEKSVSIQESSRKQSGS